MTPKLPQALIWVAGLILLLSLFVLPLLQASSRAPGSDAWSNISLGLVSSGVVLVVAVPWLRARPIRNLARSLAAANLTSIVLPVGIDSGFSVVLLADDRGLGFMGVDQVITRVLWTDVVAIAAESMDDWPNRRIRVVYATGSSDTVAVPLGGGAVRPLSDRNLRRLVARLQSLSRSG